MVTAGGRDPNLRGEWVVEVVESHGRVRHAAGLLVTGVDGEGHATRVSGGGQGQEGWGHSLGGNLLLQSLP